MSLKIQTLDFKHRNIDEEDALRKDIEIFDKLAMLDSRDENGETIISSIGNVKRIVRKVIKGLDLNIDSNINVTYTINKYYHLDLSLTLYSDDEKANIYYIFYGINEFRPYYNKRVKVAGDKFYYSYNFKGIGSYWLSDENPFFKNTLTNVEIEDQKSFADSFHVLSSFYLTLNKYRNYDDASKNNFEVRNGG
ncbi:hypothetical protein DY052_06030 [Apilactobacillus timberlakei]|uniref:hypothetical protein n=1 Tax=Apilactobacillus timberlakei TaxID=2008380 RepID=UPI00112662BF|nr:hypothetical protein [Apilactobacillus timberlakei]TPR14982.1 hypothetical protein DY052_06030 [Apilactobacillus timberlakei]